MRRACPKGPERCGRAADEAWSWSETGASRATHRCKADDAARRDGRTSVRSGLQVPDAMQAKDGPPGRSDDSGAKGPNGSEGLAPPDRSRTCEQVRRLSPERCHGGFTRANDAAAGLRAEAAARSDKSPQQAAILRERGGRRTDERPNGASTVPRDDAATRLNESRRYAVVLRERSGHADRRKAERLGVTRADGRRGRMRTTRSSDPTKAPVSVTEKAQARSPCRQRADGLPPKPGRDTPQPKSGDTGAGSDAGPLFVVRPPGRLIVPRRSAYRAQSKAAAPQNPRICAILRSSP